MEDGRWAVTRGTEGTRLEFDPEFIITLIKGRLPYHGPERKDAKGPRAWILGRSMARGHIREGG
jgi:hypothetical protein